MNEYTCQPNWLLYVTNSVASYPKHSRIRNYCWSVCKWLLCSIIFSIDKYTCPYISYKVQRYIASSNYMLFLCVHIFITIGYYVSSFLYIVYTIHYVLYRMLLLLPLLLLLFFSRNSFLSISFVVACCFLDFENPLH